MIAESILNRLADRLDVALARPTQALRAWSIDVHVVGYVDERRASLLAEYDDAFVVASEHLQLRPLQDVATRSSVLDRVARDLAARGELTRWRNERYAVRGDGVGAPLASIERAAARFFGIRTEAAHVNGTAQGRMWIARRSNAKPIDPGQLDNLVGGGIAADVGILDTLVKEAREEAGIPASLASNARAAGSLAIVRAQPDGLQRERIHVHDLELPAGFVPCNQDGEVAGFELVDATQAAALASSHDGPDVMTADAALVVTDWLLRHGHIPAHLPVHGRLAALRGAS